jgi:tRNA (cmo5U34)-methyltransferase
MADNATAHAANDYEAEVLRTIPLHAELMRQAAAAAVAAVPKPARWLDTGCGPGRMAALARSLAPDVDLWLADPSSAMLALARVNAPEVAADHIVHAASQDLPAIGPFDVITAVQCHHYEDPAGRERAVRRCRELLAPGGALVVFENVRAETDAGHAIQRARTGAWMRAQGRSADEVAAHLAREGTKFFPVKVSEHVALLASVGFATVEPFWRSYGQAGLYAVLASVAPGGVTR